MLPFHLLALMKPRSAFLPIMAAVLALLGLVSAQGAVADIETKEIKRNTFRVDIPANWKEEIPAANYKPESGITLGSRQQSYVQISIADKPADLQKVLAATTAQVDGAAITTLSKAKIEDWGPHKGLGIHLKGKILDAFPGGIKIFTYNTAHYNVLVVEYYFSSELKDVSNEMDVISGTFKTADEAGFNKTPDPTPAATPPPPTASKAS
jgi:hypothetical protein